MTTLSRRNLTGAAWTVPVVAVAASAPAMAASCNPGTIGYGVTPGTNSNPAAPLNGWTVANPAAGTLKPSGPTNGVRVDASIYRFWSQADNNAGRTGTTTAGGAIATVVISHLVNLCPGATYTFSAGVVARQAQLNTACGNVAQKVLVEIINGAAVTVYSYNAYTDGWFGTDFSVSGVRLPFGAAATTTTPGGVGNSQPISYTTSRIATSTTYTWRVTFTLAGLGTCGVSATPQNDIGITAPTVTRN